ncbi:hypothetical protein Y032_0202g1799 [Ancylostoma ceylanicum]|uniref:Uncharacterized protein n=1 Tax=Ancylostoma ceylanicum TaxID=53326 RepID=A0A016SN37_9BILA|nr:hypothetical protein Y032_0202g1799 [Ancylostoma ceylanicum]
MGTDVKFLRRSSRANLGVGFAKDDLIEYVVFLVELLQVLISGADLSPHVQKSGNYRSKNPSVNARKSSKLTECCSAKECLSDRLRCSLERARLGKDIEYGNAVHVYSSC